MGGILPRIVVELAHDKEEMLLLLLRSKAKRSTFRPSVGQHLDKEWGIQHQAVANLPIVTYKVHMYIFKKIISKQKQNKLN